MKAPLPENETTRLEVLNRYHILDTLPEEEFDDLTHLAAHICQTPIALVSLIDECRQWFKSRVGLEATETHRDLAFCAHAILKPEVLIVTDTQKDERFADNALVLDDPHIRFYAGTPLITHDGYALGTLCVIDRVPRTLNSSQIEALQALGRQAVAQLELRRNFDQLKQSITERDQAKAELEHFFELSLDMLCIINLDGHLRRFNPAFEKILGYNSEELQQLSLLNLVHPEDAEKVSTAVEQLQKQPILDLESRYRAKDGSYKWVSWRAVPSAEEGYVYAIAREISERKQIEQERMQLLAQEIASKERITTVLESISDAFFALDKNWRFTYINQQAEIILEKNREELLGQCIWDKFPEAVHLAFYEEYHRAVEEHLPVDFEEYYVPLKTWFSVHAYPSQDGGLSVYFENINKRKQVEGVLHETTMFQKAILNSANYSIISTSVDGTILTFNSAAQKWLGYSEDEVIGKATPEIIHDPQEVEERAKSLSQELGIPIEPGFEVFVAQARLGHLEEREWTYIRKDGTTFPVLLSVSVLKDHGNKVTGYLGIASDISERKETEKLLAARMRQQAGIATLGQEALSGHDLQQLMENAVALVVQGLDIEYSKVLELLAKENVLLLRAGIGWDEDLVGKTQIPLKPNSQHEFILASPETVVMEDLASESRFQTSPLLPLLQDVTLKSGISVRIRGKNTSFGIIGAYTASQRSFSADDIHFLQTVANLLATAIERNRIEESLNESQERWQLALRGNNDGIWDWNVKTGEVFYSYRWKQMLGYAEDGILPMFSEWSTRVHPEDINTFLSLIKAHFEKKTPFYIAEYRMRCSDGTYKWILDRGQALWNEQGEVIRMAGSHTDITEQKLAEEESQRQYLRSRLFAEISLKIRQSLQIDEILETAVTEVQKILHTDRVILFQLMADGSGNVVQEAVVPGVQPILGKQISDPCFQFEYLDKYRNGRVNAIPDVELASIHPCHLGLLRSFDVQANLVVPILQQQNLWGLLIAHSCSKPRQWTDFEIELLRQLSDQIGIALAQAQLLAQETRQRLELARSNTELQQFAYVASHDLQEPLRKIQAFGDRLVAKYGDVLTEQGQDYLERMQNAAGRMQILINDLLSLSRVTTKAQPFISTNLTAVVEEVLTDLEVRLQQSQGKVEIKDLPTLEADPVQMRQLFQNLIGNALKFCKPEEPPQIYISSRIIPEQQSDSKISPLCEIKIADNGIGFNEKYLDRIFNAFQRLHGRSEYEGTGMGLAICRKIVERHGGSLTAQSQPEQGATFILTLPLKQPLETSPV